MGFQPQRPVEWIGSSRADVRTFPSAVREVVGFALYQAQLGSKHRDAKPLRGMGPGILELVSRYDGDTYRMVYSVRFRETVYVLHAFQKKAKRGIETPELEIELVKRRLKAAQQHFIEVYRRG